MKPATSGRYRWLIRYPLRQWPKLVLIVGFSASASLVTVLHPWPMKILVDYALGDAEIPGLLQRLLEFTSLAVSSTVLVVLAGVVSLGLFALDTILDVGLSWTWTSAGQRMVYDLATDLFHRLQRLSLLYHSRRNVGDALSRLAGDTYCVYSATGDLLVAPGQQAFTLATIGVVAWRMDPVLTMISVAVAPLMAGSALFFAPRLKRRTRLNREAQSQVMSFVHQTLNAIPVVQAFGAEDGNRRQYQRLAADAVTRSQHGNLMQGSYGLVNGYVAALGTAVVLYTGGMRVLSGALTLGSLLVFLAYLRSMYGSIKSLLGTYGKMKAIEANLDRVMEVMETDEEVLEIPGAKALPERSAGERGHVRLDRVTFGYESGQPVLKEVSLEVVPGETIALVGPTGAGKSTLVSLVPRFFDPWEGRVLFDGVDVREVKIASLRSQIALLMQEPFLLPLSVAENIEYGRPGASREEVVDAAVAACADEFIRQLPEGYDTLVGEQGATLSGGQRQRLAIARALLKNAAVLILDEPTSALDAQTEARFMVALERLMEGRTTFIIAHRLSTIRRADQIVVLEEGSVVESGTHRDLLDAEGFYHRLYSLQVGRRR